jgi:2-polyprenyl-3-methyl-5-hydroxy-6-metoxy-1,4-benzoquinol methylase
MKELPYNKIAKDFSARRQKPWLEFFDFFSYLDNNKKILDLGCGNGRLFQFLKENNLNFDYLGIDKSENLLKIAKKNNLNTNFLNLDFNNLEKLEEKKFDYLFAIASFHHLKGEKKRIDFLKKIKKLMKKDSLFFLTNWNLYQKKYQNLHFKAYLKSFFSFNTKKDLEVPYTTKDKNTYYRYYYAFSKEELDKLFLDNGFKIVKSFLVNKKKIVSSLKDSCNICHILKLNND